MKNITPALEAVRHKQITSLGHVKGNLVRVRLDHDGYIVLVFDGGRWAAFEAYGNYNEDVTISLAADEDFEPLVCYAAGLITHDEYQEYEALMHSNIEAEKTTRERESYEILKKKFGELP